MKKFLSLFTAVLLLATLFVTAIPVAAATSSRVTLDKESYLVGDTVVATIYVDVPTFAEAGGVMFPADENIIKVTKSKSGWSDALKAYLGSRYDEEEEDYIELTPIINFAEDTYNPGKFVGGFTRDTFDKVLLGADLNTFVDGIFTITFKVEAVPVGGKITVPVTVIAQNGGVELINETHNVEIKISCAEHNYGDANWTELDDTFHGKTCTVCGQGIAAEHAWGEGTVTVEPTHTTLGEKTYTCTVCDGTKTEEIPTTGDHNFVNWAPNGDGTHTGTCGCGTPSTEACTYGEGEVTTPETCNADGVMTYTCTVCGGTKTEKIPATGDHNFVNWAPNGDGTHTGTCGCGTPSTEACTYGVVTTPAGCNSDGVKTYTCTVCGGSYTESILATGEHVYGAWTDNGDGTHTRTCTNCNFASETNNHVWDNGVVTTKPSCCDKGVTTYTCECGATYEEDIDPTNAHVYGAWTDNGDGTHTRKCTVDPDCTVSETLAHDWSAACDIFCDTCGSTRTVDESAHVYERKHNTVGHWDECSICGTKTVMVPHTMSGDACADCNYRKAANQVVSGYIYINEEYHMQVMTNGVITTKHVLNADGDCIFCLEHITDTEEIIVDVSDPVESATEEEEDTTVEAEENPETGIALAVVPMLVAMAAVVASKRR